MSILPANEKKYWIALAHCEVLMPLGWKRLLEAFPSAEAIWHAAERDLVQAGITPAVAKAMIALRTTVDPDAAMTRMEKENVRACTITEPEYPKLLKEITDPPHVLFYQGALLAEEPVGTLGVVGTRKISPYGQTSLPPIIRECASAGLTIVSGLALGIDGVAHETTIQANGRTIAVIGSGIDRSVLYPWQHRPLADRIVASGGVIVSEYPVGTAPIAHHFPARNRIIAGLSLGTLVCEAPKKSGALITAYAALDQNRIVFAIPGPIQHPNSWGPHDLLKRGAIPVTEGVDILHALTITPQQHIMFPETEDETKTSDAPLGSGSIEEKILAVVHDEITHIDAIVRGCDLTPEQVMSTLILMEMNGKVKNVGGMHYTASN